MIGIDISNKQQIDDTGILAFGIVIDKIGLVQITQATNDTVDDEIDETNLSTEVSVSLLKDQLDLAVSAEDYEEAARLRDEISKLEGQV